MHLYSYLSSVALLHLFLLLRLLFYLLFRRSCIALYAWLIIILVVIATLSTVVTHGYLLKVFNLIPNLS